MTTLLSSCTHFAEMSPSIPTPKGITMPKDKAPDATDRAKPGRKPGVPVTPPARLDFSQPVWVALHQTASRNVFATFTDEASARAYAGETAQNGGHHVVLFPPQIAQFTKTAPAATVVPLRFEVRDEQ